MIDELLPQLLFIDYVAFKSEIVNDRPILEKCRKLPAYGRNKPSSMKHAFNSFVKTTNNTL
jgi:hypothetical protein